MKKYLVTGGSGYIGENLIRLYDNHDIWFDICDYGIVNPDLPLAHQLSVEDIEGYDGIVHLAALSGLAACEKDPMLAIQENMLTAMNVFNHATNLGIPVVFTSSQAAKDPQSSKYAFIKWGIEQFAEYYNQDGGMVYVLRLANVYGGYGYLNKKQTCVKQFITNYKEGLPLVIHGDGTQKRDFIHVWDVCKAIMLTLEKKPIDKSPMDIGTGKSTSIIELKEMFHCEHKLVPMRDVGTQSSIANINEAKKRIGFIAERKLEDYIKENLYRKEMKNGTRKKL